MVNSIKSKEELLHSRPIDVHKACYHKDIWHLRDKIYDEYIRPLTKNSSSSVKRHLQKILVDVYHARLHDPDLLIRVSFNNNDYILNSRYNKIHITQTTLDVLRTLIKLGFLHHKEGMPAREVFKVGPSYQSRIWPSDKLISLLDKAKFNILNIRSYDIDRETIVLNKKVKTPKAKKKYKNVPIDYSDTPAIRSMRLVMTCYNELLRTTHIDIASTEKDYVSSFDEWDQENKRFINQQCFMYRGFSDSTFEKGGRIQGGWWESCPSFYRQHIYINGNPTVEIDFNSTHPAILYQMEGLNFFDIADGRDLYDLNVPELDNVPHYHLANYTRQHLADFKRFLIKRLTLVGLNAKDEKGLFGATVKAITAEDKNPNSPIKRPPAYILETISDSFLASIWLNIKQKHQPIAHHFLSGVSPRLMRIESNITSNLIEHFTALKVPILTVHDSYIVEKRWGETLVNAMQSAWMEEMARLQAKPNSKPRKSKYLMHLTSHVNDHQRRQELAEPIEYVNAVAGYGAGRTKLKQIGNYFLGKSRKTGLASIWSSWNADVVSSKPTAPLGAPTERYKMSLKMFQNWLKEPENVWSGTHREEDNPEVNARYDGLEAMVNINLYTQWKHCTPVWMRTIDDMSDKELDDWKSETVRDQYE
jgi:hypothetical protein